VRSAKVHSKSETISGEILTVARCGSHAERCRKSLASRSGAWLAAFGEDCPSGMWSASSNGTRPTTLLTIFAWICCSTLPLCGRCMLLIIIFCGAMPLPIMFGCSIAVTPRPAAGRGDVHETLCCRSSAVYPDAGDKTGRTGGAHNGGGGSMRWQQSSVDEKGSRGRRWRFGRWREGSSYAWKLCPTTGFFAGQSHSLRPAVQANALAVELRKRCLSSCEPPGASPTGLRGRVRKLIEIEADCREQRSNSKRGCFPELKGERAQK
jgi:hypothetical protein